MWLLNMKPRSHPAVCLGGRRRCGFTLAEILVAMALSVMVLGAVLFGYISSAQRAEWSASAFAAQSMALQRLEQTRAARWDPWASPPLDELVSEAFPIQIRPLDMPRVGTNVLLATNVITITMLSSNPPLKMVQVDCVWSYLARARFTNTVVTYRAPDQ